MLFLLPAMPFLLENSCSSLKASVKCPFLQALLPSSSGVPCTYPVMGMIFSPCPTPTSQTLTEALGGKHLPSVVLWGAGGARQDVGSDSRLTVRRGPPALLPLPFPSGTPRPMDGLGTGRPAVLCRRPGGADAHPTPSSSPELGARSARSGGAEAVLVGALGPAPGGVLWRWAGGGLGLWGAWRALEQQGPAPSPILAAVWPWQGWLGLPCRDLSGALKATLGPSPLGGVGSPEMSEGEEGGQGARDHRGLTSFHLLLPGALMGPLPTPSLTGWLWAPSSQCSPQVPGVRASGHCIAKSPSPHPLFHTALPSSSPRVAWGRALGKWEWKEQAWEEDKRQPSSWPCH